MQNYAITHNLTPFVNMQNCHTAIYREEEREMNRLLEHYGVGSTPWSPLQRGLLSRPNSARKDSERSKKDPYVDYFEVDEASAKIIDEVERISKAKNVSMAQVAVAWLLSKKVVSAPIVGSTKVANIEDIAKGAQLKLTEEEIKVSRTVKSQFTLFILLTYVPFLIISGYRSSLQTSRGRRALGIEERVCILGCLVVSSLRKCKSDCLKLSF